MAKTLAELTERLECLRARASLPFLMRELEELPAELPDLRQYIHFSESAYSRNLVRQSDWYALLVLCWKNGQRSPIHDHAGSSCGVRVLRGVMTETRFDFAPNGHVKALSSCELAAGGICGSQDYDLHQVSNLQPGGAELVTLHIYSPPLVWMGTYSIFNTERGREPMLLEFTDAAGI
jgi:cysteine dioxygenase